MRQNGAPIWRLSAPMTSTPPSRIESKGGKTLMPPRHPAGRIAMAATRRAIPLRHKPIPPEGAKRWWRATGRRTASQLNELSTLIQAARHFGGELFGWGSEELADMGEFGEYRFWDFAGR